MLKFPFPLFSWKKRVIGMRLMLVVTMALLALSVAEAKSALIYKNEACGHCGPYLAELVPMLEQNGYSVAQKEFINDESARAELALLKERFGVPIQLQGHMSAIIEDRYLLEGHVPLSVVSGLLGSDAPAGLVVIQDSMNEGEAGEYQVLLGGKVSACSVEIPAAECAGGGGNAGAAGSGAGFDFNIALAAAIAIVPIGIIFFARGK